MSSWVALGSTGFMGRNLVRHLESRGTVKGFGSKEIDLRKSGQMRDLEFILAHIDDLDSAFTVKHDEIVRIPNAE